MINSTLCYIEKDGKYLMLCRDKKENDCNEGKWIGVGGRLEENESPDECLVREVKEETSLSLLSYKMRGIVTFVSDRWETEEMYLFTSDSFLGEVSDCDEGTLKWVEKAEILKLPLWEGDKLFLKLIAEESDFFLMKLEYEGEDLKSAKINGKELPLEKG
ncbi:MAG: 8-oxo-dGTP diphosphatase [Clostridia bacterium]|nr:8-oxo-dGTP diphosphatase [Clostridia bacterium]